METNSKFVDETLTNFKVAWKKGKKEVDECHQKILYLEAYSRRENVKLEGIDLFSSYILFFHFRPRDALVGIFLLFFH